MITLSDLTERIGRQFLDPHGLAAPQETREEAVRLALEEINLSLNQTYTIAGLDGSVAGDLPETCLPRFQRRCCGAHWHRAALRPEQPYQPAGRPAAASALTEHLKRQFDLEIDKTAREELQNAQSETHFQWEWSENRGWR